MWMHTGGCG
uniref:Uncharacterized protein n=1 Tax=Anguilla anguilla TaxID=7936 RepID=A0A0E9U236_ANGAN